MERGKSMDFHRAQLDDRIVATLLTLDLANKPEAQKPLVDFLTAMGIQSKIIDNSRVGKTIEAAKDYARLIKNSDPAGEIANFVA